MPAASAASTQPRKPMPVVTTTASGGAASRALVSRSSCSSWWFGTMLRAGAWRTVAPRLVRAEASSAERRSAVTSTTHPAMTCPEHAHVASRSPAAATAPTTITAGASTPADSAAATMPLSGARVTRCPGSVPLSTIATGVSGLGARGHQLVDVLGEQGDAHEHHERGTAVHHRADRRLAERAVAVRDVGGTDESAVGQGDTRRGGGRERAAHPRDDLDRYAVGAARLHLLAAAAEEVGVTALEPHHRAAALGLLDDDAVDLLLGHRVVPGGLAHVDDLDGLGQVVEQAGGPETVGDHDVGLRQRAPTADGHEVRRAGTAADQDDPSPRRRLALRAQVHLLQLEGGGQPVAHA